MQKIISCFITCYVLTLGACLAGDTISVETIGAVRHVDFKEAKWGAGADLGYKLNSFVTGHVRAIAYEENDWGGGAIDEGSVYVEAQLLKSANGKLTLGAVGGGSYDFSRGDFGFGVGLRPKAKIYGQLYAFGQSEIRAWFNGPKDILTTFGLGISF